MVSLCNQLLLMGLHVEDQSVKIQTDLPSLSLNIAETLGGIDRFLLTFFADPPAWKCGRSTNWQTCSRPPPIVLRINVMGVMRLMKRLLFRSDFECASLHIVCTKETGSMPSPVLTKETEVCKPGESNR
jgi:hypothetical protein